MRMTRREGLLSALFGTGYVGLRALATGLPVWYLLDPRRASADDMSCLVTAKANLQYLILSTSSNGDPINCNCPGTYEASAIVHPTQAEVAATSVTLGSKTMQAALPWATTASGGALSTDVLARTSFFHHSTGTTVHGDQPKVMKLLGDLSGGEMFVSAVAKHLSICLGTVQAEPIALGAGSNASELVSFAGRTLPSIRPTQLKQLLTGSKTDPLAKLQTLRDTSLNELNALAKTDATGVQSQFLDALATSQTQVRALASQLSSTLSAIADDGLKGQALAAAALIAANVTPVVTIRIPFGGDNHQRSEPAGRGRSDGQRRPGDPDADDQPRVIESHRQGHVRHVERLRPKSQRHHEGDEPRGARPLREPRRDRDDRKERRAGSHRGARARLQRRVRRFGHRLVHRGALVIGRHRRGRDARRRGPDARGGAGHPGQRDGERLHRKRGWKGGGGRADEGAVTAARRLTSRWRNRSAIRSGGRSHRAPATP